MASIKARGAYSPPPNAKHVLPPTRVGLGGFSPDLGEKSCDKLTQVKRLFLKQFQLLTFWVQNLSGEVTADR